MRAAALASLAGLAAGGPAAPPFSYGQDQTVPCPVGSADYLLADAAGRAPITPDEHPEVAAALAKVPALLRLRLQQLRSASTGVLVTHNNRVIYSEFAGAARAGGAAPPTPDSGFLIASNTKVFTAAMLYRLRDQGRLPPRGVDSPVTDLLPGFSIGGGGRGITLRALAMHASGLPREHPDCDSCSTEEMLPLIAKLAPISAPWQFTHYSNLGIALLGRALEKAANKTWERFIKEDILAPLGMNSSGVPPWDAAGRERMADGIDQRTGKVAPLAKGTTWGAPCGAMYSTPRDMGTWMSFLMDAGDEGDRERWAKVLDPATRAEMRNTMMTQGDGISGIGAGTFESGFVGGRRWVVNKLGCITGYRSAMSMVPTLGLGVFGVATSTCDLYGDGDAVSFPLVYDLIPAVGAVLERAALRAAPLPPDAQAMQGRYCSSVLRIENVSYGDASGANGTALVMRPTTEDSPFMFQLLSTLPGGGATFRAVMGPDRWLPAGWAGCSQAASPGADLCPVSCNRKMARGSGAIVSVVKQGGEYEYSGCKRQPL